MTKKQEIVAICHRLNAEVDALMIPGANKGHVEAALGACRDLWRATSSMRKANSLLGQAIRALADTAKLASTWEDGHITYDAVLAMALKQVGYELRR